jgi:hypothetical protein
MVLMLDLFTVLQWFCKYSSKITFSNEDGGSIFIRNVGKQPDYTASQPRIHFPSTLIIDLALFWRSPRKIF